MVVIEWSFLCRGEVESAGEADRRSTMRQRRGEKQRRAKRLFGTMRDAERLLWHRWARDPHRHPHHARYSAAQPVTGRDQDRTHTDAAPQRRAAKPDGAIGALS